MPITTETLPGGTVVHLSDNHRFGTDSLLLADFCEIRADWTACDLGSGCGILLLSLADKGLRGYGLGVDIDKEAAELLKSAAEANKLENIHSYHGEMQGLTTPRPFDVVVSNPPYFSAGAVSSNPVRAAARHEQNCTIYDVCAAAGKLLKDKGRFYVCWPPDRMTDLFAALQQAKLEPKKMQFVRKNADSPPWLMLLDARKNGGKSLRILPDRLIKSGNPLKY